MEDLKAPTFPKPVLTAEDTKRMRGCDFYLKAKEVIQSAQDYKEFEVGSAVHIVRKESGRMISSDYEGKNPEKYIIIENDEGFVFVKRIKVDGRPGATVTCVTIDYPSKHYELRVDDGYIESMLLDTQDSYDPAAEAKNLAKRKNKASRENSKVRVVFETAQEAYSFVKSLTVGETFFSTEFSYGGSVTEYKVDSIDIRDAKPSTSAPCWSRNYGDDEYLNRGFKEVIEVKLKVVNSTAKYSYDKILSFKDLSKENYANYSFFYRSKPISPEDLAQ